MPKTNLDLLLRSAQTGGRKSAQAFLSEARPLVCRWAVMWTGSPDAAEDIAQKVLIKVHRAIPQYVPGTAKGWLYRIARNAFVDWERGRSSEKRLRDRLMLQRLVEDVADEVRVPSPVAQLLLELIDELSPRQRSVLELVDLQGFEPSEVAEMLDLAPDTVRVHLHRARKTLRSRWAEADQGPTTREIAHG